MSTYKITAVPTKHPEILKFDSNGLVSPHKNYEFQSMKEAEVSPLAQELFMLPFVKAVYLSSHFVGIHSFLHSSTFFFGSRQYLLGKT